MRRILITGASTWTGGHLIARLEQRQGIEVFGVDEIPPRIPFSSPFAQLNMDRTELAAHVLDIEPDTVVHLLTVDRAAELGKAGAHEQAVLGVQALFGAIGRSQTVRHVIVKSDAAIYPSSPRSPSVFSEMTRGRSTTRYGRELDDLESLIEQLVPLHDHVRYTVLRLAPIFGATVDNPLSRYLRLPILPTLLGFDPRLHILHESDAVGAFVAAIDSGQPGTFNVASGPPVYLSRIARLGKRRTQPLPKRGFEAAMRGLARMGQPLPSHVIDMIHHGVVLDTQKMSDTLGFAPQVMGREAVLAAYGFDGATAR